jgi:hypothetical protein
MCRCCVQFSDSSLKFIVSSKLKPSLVVVFVVLSLNYSMVVLFSFNMAAILDLFYFLFRLLQPYYKAMALLLSDFELCTISL